MMTDQTGQVVWKAEYLPFGEPVSINEDVDGDGMMVVNNLRFPGQYADGETGLNYNWARYYETGIGRYTTIDPNLESKITAESKSCGFKIQNRITEHPQNRHPYIYVTNNPMTNYDPTGLFSIIRCTASNASTIQFAAEIAASKAETCLDCNDQQPFKDTLSKITFVCTGTDFTPNGPACGYVENNKSKFIKITPSGLSRANGCGCLQSTILHEVTHLLPNHPYSDAEADAAEHKCFSCGR
jgi:RHS repeat-associated protein